MGSGFAWLKDVVIVSPTSGGVGGVGQHVRTLADRLWSRGYSVEVISSSNTPIMNVKGLMNPSFALTSLFKSIGRRCRVVHAHSIPSTPAMKAVNAETKVLTLHGFYSEQVTLLHGGLLGGIVSWFEKKALRWADVVTAVSRTSADAYRRMGYDVRYIPNAVDLASLPRDGLKLSSPQVVFVGRLSPEKGLDTLIEAASIARDLNFLIVGGGPYGTTIKAKSAGLTNVRLMGAVSHEDALRYIAGSDVVVLPSYVEGLSTVILEAMAMHVPVVATAVGGNNELIEDGVTGLLVRPGDPEGLAEAMTRLVNDVELSRRMACEAYKRVSEEYSWDRVFSQYLRVYGFDEVDVG